MNQRPSDEAGRAFWRLVSGTVEFYGAVDKLSGAVTTGLVNVVLHAGIGDI